MLCKKRLPGADIFLIFALIICAAYEIHSRTVSGIVFIKRESGNVRSLGVRDRRSLVQI